MVLVHRVSQQQGGTIHNNPCPAYDLPSGLPRLHPLSSQHCSLAFLATNPQFEPESESKSTYYQVE